jgi:hypothetical protein
MDRKPGENVCAGILSDECGDLDCDLDCKSVGRGMPETVPEKNIMGH